MSRKDDVNKNNYYMVKGSVPNYLPNKPTVMGSSEIPPGYFNKPPIGSGVSNNNGGGTNLPVLNNPYVSSVV